MNRSILDSFIIKYNILGRVDGASWKSDGNSLSTSVTTTGNHLIAFLSTDQLQFPEGEYHLNNTSTLRSLLGVLDDEIDVNPIFDSKDRHIGFEFKDKDTKVKFYLSEKDTIPVIPAIKSLPPFDIQVKLDAKLYTKVSKAVNAVKESDVITFISDGVTARLIVGYTITSVNNSVAIDLVTTQNTVMAPTNFLAEDVRDVLALNKEMKDGEMLISSKGRCIQFSFDLPNFSKAQYFVMPQSNS